VEVMDKIVESQVITEVQQFLHYQNKIIIIIIIIIHFYINKQVYLFLYAILDQLFLAAFFNKSYPYKITNR
jgi:hypothetical protein